MKTTSRTISQIVRAHTLTYFNLLNVILAGFIILSGQYKNMLFMGIVISNSLIGIIQECKVKSLIDKLSVITATKARKLAADGTITEIPIESLAVSDTIHIMTGDQIVADGEVLTSDGLEVNESHLTGESIPVFKKPGDFLYSGSFIVAGSGTAKVLKSVEDSYAAKLTKKAQTKRRATSEMQDAIKRIIRYVSFAIVPIGAALFCIQYFRADDTLSNALVSTVAGVLGMIPEGLVLLTSVSFILGVGRLARKKALVQEMEAIEALARVNVLCLDKTGTITTGKLTVDEVIPFGVDKEMIHDIMGTLVYAFTETNATSTALQAFFKETDTYSVTDSVPFSSRRKFMGIQTKDKCFLLGAPDYLTKDDEILKKAATYSNEGLRVLLLGSCQKLYKDAKEIEKFTPLSLIVLSDCVKEDALDTFAFFAKQGVAVKVISGDDPVTVSYIARLAGIPGADAYIDAGTLPDDIDELCKIAPKYSVFGRVTPEKKQALVHAFQNAGHVVGMVGDGINDVLALKDADCGIAMANGADAAKQCAHNRNSKFFSCPRKTRRADNNRILMPCPAYFASCRTHSVCRNLRHPVFVPSFWFYNSISSDAESVSRWRCLPRCRSTRLPSMDKAQNAFIHPNDNYFRLRHPCRTTLFRSLVPAGIYSCNIIHIRTGSSSNKQIACADMP